MVPLRKYRIITSRDGLEDEGDWSLSLSRMDMLQFQRRFNVFCVFCVASYNEEYVVCSPDVRFSPSVDEGRPLNSSGSSEERCDSKIFMLSAQQSPAHLVLLLWLDSGATHHAVGDARILCNLRDPPAGTAVVAADGARLLVRKIGDIQTQYIKIQDVYLVLGLQENLISVRQLAKDNKIVTTFYENYAELWCEGNLVGGAIVDNVTSLYRLRYLMPPLTDPEAGTSRYICEEAMDVATAGGATSREEAMDVAAAREATSHEEAMDVATARGATSREEAMHVATARGATSHEKAMDMATARGATSRNSSLQLRLSLSLSTSMSTESKQQQQQRCLKQDFRCKTCGRCFSTYQALCGHRTSHKGVRPQQVHADDLLGARSGKGAAQTVHRCYFTGEVFPVVQALCRHRAAFHVANGGSRWPFNIGDYKWALANYSETSLVDGERWHSSGDQRTVVPSVERGTRVVHLATSYPACPMCMLYK